MTCLGMVDLPGDGLYIQLSGDVMGDEKWLNTAIILNIFTTGVDQCKVITTITSIHLSTHRHSIALSRLAPEAMQ